MNTSHCRIALVVSRLNMGGMEQSVVNLASSLFEDGYRPVIVCLEASYRFHNRVSQADVKVIEMNKQPGNDLKLPFRLAKILKRERADIVHSHNWGTLVECLVAAKSAGVQAVVHTQHGMGFEVNVSRANDHLRVLAQRLACRWITKIVAVSKEVEEMILREWRVPVQKVSVIHNGVGLERKIIDDQERLETRRRLGLRETDFIIGSVGVFRPVKDFPTLVEAMSEVVRQAPQARLILIGDGPARKEIEEAVYRFKLTPFVQLLGQRSDVYDLLPLMDLFVLCSHSEGISLAILEAMGAGLAVVATRVGGNPEIITDKETGILVPPSSPGETARAILFLMKQQSKRRDMGLRGRERVQTHFSAERMARDYEKLYAELIG